ncbi:hypothetical protein [Moraxella sp.]|uniref:hypothetical protein n=1 Tax=Moraxella sp. TaxID=479 RepID=UPI0026DB4C55|nr:hypothetical protein [Moraxella sp.]MDO4895358.1 hypothetical protein [Moraxella sp.]
MKITQEDKELLDYLKTNNKSDIFKYVNLICQTNSSNPDGHLYMQLAYHCMDQFFVEYYLNKDVNTAKNWAKLSAWSFAESCQYKRGWDMWDNSKILPVVLSDDKVLIERYSTLDTINIPERETKPYKEHENDPKSGQFDTIAMQYLLQSNWGKLHQMAQCAQNVKTDQFQRWFFEFCFALEKREEVVICKVIERFSHPKVHQYLNQYLTITANGRLLSLMPALLTKISWQNGLKIHLNNPFVPMDLMPVSEPTPIDFGFELPKPRVVELKSNKNFWKRLFFSP